MAYTKYSLTPANNTAAPPDGAPEGMLPSAVNDTMRDMMAQIRDVGDGIRGGTYTMTAPVITGGSITGVALSGNTFTSPVISGGSINNTPIGASTANTGAFTTLGATGVATFSAGTVSAPAITTTGDTNTGIFFPAADTIAFTEGGVESMRIDSSGNVGIGATPNTGTFNRELTLSSGAGQFCGFTIQNTTTGTSGGFAAYINNNLALLYNRSNDGLVLGTNNTERMRIDSAGNCGIGTSSPAARFQVNSATGVLSRFIGNNANNYIELSDDNGTTTATFGAIGGGNAYMFATTGKYAAFYTGGSERMRIDSSGNLLVGTTSAAAQITAQTSTSDIYSGYNGANQKFAVTNGGTIFAVNTTISAISDIRYKENIRNLDVGLDKILALKPRLYDWKEGKGSDIKNARGFIAQEFEQVFPDLIDVWKDPAPEGEEPYKSVRQDLIPVLVKAIQEQQALIENLTTRLDALEGK
jgi:hypothetical protein